MKFSEVGGVEKQVVSTICSCTGFYSSNDTVSSSMIMPLPLQGFNVHSLPGGFTNSVYSSNGPNKKGRHTLKCIQGQTGQAGYLYSILTNLTDTSKKTCFKQACFKRRALNRGNIIFYEGQKCEEVVLKDREIFLLRMTYNEP